jgi:hypothetical protein
MLEIKSSKYPSTPWPTRNSLAAIGHAISTQANTLDDIRSMAKDAVKCDIHDADSISDNIRLHSRRGRTLVRASRFLV